MCCLEFEIEFGFVFGYYESLMLLLEILWLNIHEVFMIFICVLEFFFVYYGVLIQN